MRKNYVDYRENKNIIETLITKSFSSMIKKKFTAWTDTDIKKFYIFRANIKYTIEKPNHHIQIIEYLEDHHD